MLNLISTKKNTFIRKDKYIMIDDEIAAKLREIERPPYNSSSSEEDIEKIKDDIFDDTVDKPLENKNNDYKKSNEGSNKKRKIDFSIVRENGKLIHSSESIPLNSILVNIIGATIGNCSKNGDEFKFNLNVEENGSINLQVYAPNNKLNNNIISKIFNIVSDENNMDSKILNFIYNAASKISSVNNGFNSGNKYSKNPWTPWSSKVN